MKTYLLFWVQIFFVTGYCYSQNYAIGHHGQHNPDYFDALRNRNVWTEVYYPANTAGDDVPVASGQFPVIVFGHGFTLQWSAYDYFWEYFVPKGYICVFPRTEGGIFPAPNHGNFGGDLAFLARLFTDSLNNQNAGLFYQHIQDKVAIMGHSMGGGCSFLASENNPDITTMITFAAANTNPSSINAAAGVSVPTLVISGEEDCVAPVTQHQIPMYNALPNTICKYYVEIAQGSHCHFTNGVSGTASDICYTGEGTSCIGWGPFITAAQQHDRTFRLIEPWLKYYLYADCSGWSDFTANVNSMTANAEIVQELHNCTISVPEATVSASGSTTFCDGQSVTLSANNGANCVWSNGTNGCSTVVNTSGSYTVTVSNGTCSSTSSPVIVTVNPSPAIPVITQSGNLLSVSITGNYTYSWTINGTAAGTASTQSTGSVSGSAVVTITDANGCSSTSSPFNFTQSSVFLPALAAEVSISPNPVTGQLFAQIQFSEISPVTVSILDLQGKELQTILLENQSEYSCNFIVENYSNGMYFIQIQNKKGSIVKKWIKQ